MSEIILLNKHQKKALVVDLYKQGKTRRQIAEVVHMGFKDIADIINEYTGEDKQINKLEKSKDARAFELFLQGKQSVEVAIELDMPADRVEELHVQYWRLSKLDNLEIMYHEAEYSLSLLLRLHNILRDKRITKDKDICDLIELTSDGLPSLRNRHEELLGQLTVLENEKSLLGSEILGLRSSINTNNEIIRKQNVRLHTLDRKRRVLEVMLQNASKESKYHKVMEIVDQRLEDKRSMLVAALVAILQTLKANPYGLNLLNSSSVDIDDYVDNDIDGKSFLQFAESCYNLLLKSFVKTIA
jgi:arsenate reductase-like glutaredoxin family protein